MHTRTIKRLQKKKSPIGWWIAGAALVIVIVVVAVLAIRARDRWRHWHYGWWTGWASVAGRVSAGGLVQVLRLPPRTRPTDESTEVRSPTRCSVRHGGRR